MARFVQGMIMMALAVFAGNCLLGQDTKPKFRGQLYTKWRELGLTDEQKQQVYTLQTEYRSKIADLDRKIRELRREERTKAEAILTPAQKARLRELLLGAKDKPDSATKDKDKPIKPTDATKDGKKDK